MNDDTDDGIYLVAAFNDKGELERVEDIDVPLVELGDRVHYVSHGSAPRRDGEQTYPPRCRVAIVTELSYLDRELTKPGSTVGLCVLNPTGMNFLPLDAGGSDHAEPETYQREGGTWHRRGTC